jgi:hypothetical protein
MTAATLFGIPPKGTIENSVLDAVDETERAAQAAVYETEERARRLVVQAVDLFRARPLNWVTVNPTRFALPLGTSTLLLVATPDHRWQIRELDRDRHDRVLHAGLDLGYAQGWAEDHARRPGAGRLIDRAASWRMDPASDKQLETLRRCRVPVRPGLTKGEAADLLTAVFARAR